MNATLSRLAPRQVLCMVLGTSLLCAPNPALAPPAMAYAHISELKSVAQLKSEAVSHDQAIAAVSKIAGMKLDSLDQLKAAGEILARYTPSLRLASSKLAVMAMTDSTFVNAVNKKMADKGTAEAFARELNADPNAVLKLDGASSLQSRMNSHMSATASMLRSVSSRLKEAAERVKKADAGFGAPGMLAFQGATLSPVGFGFAGRGKATEAYLVEVPSPQSITVLTILAMIVIFTYSPFPVLSLAAAVAFGTVLTAAIIADLILHFGKKVGTEEGRDALDQCLNAADARYRTCANTATGIFGPAILAACWANYLYEAGVCYLK